MPTKAELLEQADAEGIDVPSGATKAEVEALLGGQAAEEATPGPQAAPEQQTMPVAQYLSDLTPAERRYKMSHWP